MDITKLKKQVLKATENADARRAELDAAIYEFGKAAGTLAVVREQLEHAEPGATAADDLGAASSLLGDGIHPTIDAADLIRRALRLYASECARALTLARQIGADEGDLLARHPRARQNGARRSRSVAQGGAPQGSDLG